MTIEINEMAHVIPLERGDLDGQILSKRIRRAIVEC
jgi:hypothetical protein